MVSEQFGSPVTLLEVRRTWSSLTCSHRSGVLHEDFEEDEHQVCESASSEWSCGEEEPPSQEDKKVEVLEISRSVRYFYSVVRTFSVFYQGGLSGGEDGFTTGRFGGRNGSAQGGVAGNSSSEKCNCLERKSLGGVFERGGAGGSGSGGGPGFYAGKTGGVVGCWSSECGPESMNVVLSSGVRNGDFSSGFSGGGLVGRRLFVSGGFAGGKLQGWLLGGFQKSLEREEFGRSLSGSFVGLERKSKMKSSSKGIIVIHLEDIAKFISQLSRASDRIDCHSGFLRMNGLTHLKPNLSSFGVTYKLNSSDVGFGKFRPIHPTSVLKPKFITQIVHCNFPYPQPTNPKSTKTNSTQNSMLCSHDMLIKYSDFPAIEGSQEGARIFNNDQEFLVQFSLAFVLFKSWVRGRESMFWVRGWWLVGSNLVVVVSGFESGGGGLWFESGGGGLWFESCGESLFNAFATAAFFKFVVFSIFEMRYLLAIWKASRPANSGEGWEAMRRELSLLLNTMCYLAFSNFQQLLLLSILSLNLLPLLANDVLQACLNLASDCPEVSVYPAFLFDPDIDGILLGGILIMYEFHNFLRVILLLMYSFWIPQIVTNVIRDSRKPLHPHYILGMTITRLAIPLYVFGCPNNFMRIGPDKNWCICLCSFMGLQALVLLLQHYLGSRCFIPRQILPEKYSYYRRFSQDTNRTTDCVICMTAIDLSEHSNDCMVTPCDHFFHSGCLQRWMDIKMECPTCRRSLPPA
uniref:RING-type E3 ubiquitin transferase n=1 Tax=Chenopodium quinoa TaxID=63459 RepID=A0A803MR34_CHEQI